MPHNKNRTSGKPSGKFPELEGFLPGRAAERSPTLLDALEALYDALEAIYDGLEPLYDTPEAPYDARGPLVLNNESTILKSTIVIIRVGILRIISQLLGFVARVMY